MNNALFFIPILMGTFFLIAGFILLKFPGKKINSSYGYRTFRSMKNQQTWDFAQLYSAKESIKLGIILALCSVIGIWYNPNKGITITLGLILIIGPVIILITNVERAIKRKFRNEHEQKPN
ncbi:MAG: SdpI family protein [Chitinophagaceae bacterium]|nr:SdpI family protein [Chitinophagaceae bacterium]